MKDLAVTDLTLDAAIRFLWEEADILDRQDYQAWLPLWAEGGMYVIPIKPDTDDFANNLNLIYDDAKMRKARVDRLQAGFSISAAPPAQSVRTVSRFVVTDQGENSLTVRSALHVIEDKFGRQRAFAANVTHELMLVDGEIRIASKVVRLLNSDGVLTSVSYLF
ncbi:aromatic-ring-hydroxylating dioxygenase subunit beta [Chachezhania antarctica]|uniref:aromatic-ring-hydroxylating dioxygenase subunit beta n=1 Tax=Chachezhania antarctica TaxID=2340860 RepID=UPI000EB2A30F|nr:aromatic-ring-hydroxylating dioxygenase subunit beta [Chachezhania antarctica]|tara:strand:+ start:1637 stop:2128 length:492 start_codon:yes stop_codon:yes gene_type:complete